MKTWVWLALIILPLGAGCAPGYYETEPSSVYQDYQQPYPTFYTNPETTEEYLNRIWRESASGEGCCPGRN